MPHALGVAHRAFTELEGAVQAARGGFSSAAALSCGLCITTAVPAGPQLVRHPNKSHVYRTLTNIPSLPSLSLFLPFLPHFPLLPVNPAAGSLETGRLLGFPGCVGKLSERGGV